MANSFVRGYNQFVRYVLLCNIVCFFGSCWLVLSMDKKRTPPKGRPMTESQLQTKCVSWFNSNFPELRGLLYHNYNNPRNAVSGARLKAQGLVAGIPDLSLAAGSMLYIELKTEGGRVSIEQKSIHRQLEASGFEVKICWDLEEFVRAVVDHLDGFNFIEYSYAWNYDENKLEREGPQGINFIGV